MGQSPVPQQVDRAVDDAGSSHFSAYHYLVSYPLCVNRFLASNVLLWSLLVILEVGRLF